MRFAITPLERHAYSKARMIIVNYKCVEDQFINEFGTEVEVRRLPYASEEAFLCQPPEAAPALDLRPRANGSPSDCQPFTA